VSNELWQIAQQRGCPPDKPHSVIHAGVDPTFFDPTLFDPESQVHGDLEHSEPIQLITVGRLEWEKGHEYALMALKEVIDTGVEARFTIVGAGEYRDPLQLCVDDLGLGPYVTFLGGVAPSRVAQELATADIAVHASLAEGICNAALEAQAMQVPVACFAAPGMSEAVEDGVTGLVVPRRDHRALADAIIRLARDPELRQKMGQAGRKRVVDLFGLDRQLDEIVSFYEEVASPNAASKETA
jgi:colanic acid/amylovoran biosynthesis glycosyltransferase